MYFLSKPDFHELLGWCSSKSTLMEMCTRWSNYKKCKLRLQIEPLRSNKLLSDMCFKFLRHTFETNCVQILAYMLHINYKQIIWFGWSLVDLIRTCGILGNFRVKHSTSEKSLPSIAEPVGLANSTASCTDIMKFDTGCI